MRIPKFEAQTEWVKPTEFPDLRQVDEIAIDLETYDPDLKSKGSGSVIGNGEIIGVAVAVDGWCKYYPFGHEGGGNLDKKRILEWLKSVCATETTKVFHNAMYDICWIRTLGNIAIGGEVVDTMIASALVDENQLRYDLNHCARRYTGQGKDEGALYNAAKEWGVDPKQEMYKLPAMYVGAYAQRDAELTLALWQEAKKGGLATANIGLLTDIIACPGGDFCSLANAKSIPIALAIQERFDNLDYVHDLGEISLNISGCINACGHHHVGNIGVLGVDKDGEEWYQVTLGGAQGNKSAIGKVIGPSFKAEEMPDVVSHIIDTYVANRHEDERFIDVLGRIGIAPFKERVYADKQRERAEA